MDYSRLSFRDLQKEASNLGIKPLRGKGIDRAYLIKKIEEKLAESIEDLDDKDETLNGIQSDAQRTLFEQNRDLHDFLLPIIDNVPSMRPTPEAPFKENPWNIILDELNAMTESQYDILDILTNGEERDIFALVVNNSTILYNMFESYPLLTYAIVARRRVEDPWIQIAVVLSDASSLYPHSDFIKEPLYTKEEFHPFSSLYLSNGTKGVFEAVDVIKFLNYDENAILEFWRSLLRYSGADKIPIEYYRLFEIENKEGITLPLNEDILDIYSSIYEVYEESHPQEAFIFANAVARSIISDKREETSHMIVFMQMPMFHQMVKELLKIPHEPIVIYYSGKTVLPINYLINAFIDPLLFMTDNGPIDQLGRSLIPFSRTLRFRASGFIGRVIGGLYWTDNSKNMTTYGHNLGIFSNYNILALPYLIDEAMIINSKKIKEQIFRFFDALLRASNEDNKTIIKYALSSHRKRLISVADRKKLEKI